MPRLPRPDCRPQMHQPVAVSSPRQRGTHREKRVVGARAAGNGLGQLAKASTSPSGVEEHDFQRVLEEGSPDGPEHLMTDEARDHAVQRDPFRYLAPASKYGVCVA
jgi:hypothetical protein